MEVHKKDCGWSVVAIVDKVGKATRDPTAGPASNIRTHPTTDVSELRVRSVAPKKERARGAGVGVYLRDMAGRMVVGLIARHNWSYLTQNY